MDMFHRLPRVCIVFCVIAKYIQINSINGLNFIIFLMKEQYVLREVETICLYVI